MKKHLLFGLLALSLALVFCLAFASCGGGDDAKVDSDFIRATGTIDGKWAEAIINKSGNFGKAALEPATGQKYVIRFIEKKDIFSEGTIEWNDPYIKFIPKGKPEDAFSAYYGGGNNLNLTTIKAGGIAYTWVPLDVLGPSASPEPRILASVLYDQPGAVATFIISTSDGEGGVYKEQDVNFTFKKPDKLVGGGDNELALSGSASINTTAGDPDKGKITGLDAAEKTPGVYEVDFTGASVSATGEVEVTLDVDGKETTVLKTIIKLLQPITTGGSLTANYSQATGIITATLTGGPTIPIYNWSGDNVANSGSNLLIFNTGNIGKEITCKVLEAGRSGYYSATKIVYRATINKQTGAGAGETATIILPYNQSSGSIAIDLVFGTNSSSRKATAYQFGNNTSILTGTNSVLGTGAGSITYTVNPIDEDPTGSGLIPIELKWENQ